MLKSPVLNPKYINMTHVVQKLLEISFVNPYYTFNYDQLE